ncbi:peptidase M23B [Caballeronia arvi]|uniref:Peptidase M23B n=1 Tax=Caballeronia arvi TaxID=1777135 RepID=A0A158JLB4_9BURK|nr:peptidoglycan DD-metalloendopeptidase family protein [Caballeronia arvi]SAL69597.1 peptidase M23B [Caballeronia arvi]
MCIPFIAAGCASNASKPEAQPVISGSLIAPTPATALPAGYYVAAPGDTLASIANAYGRSVTELASWNAIPADGALSVGQRLRVGPPAASSSRPTQSEAVQPALGKQAADRFPWPATGPLIAAFGASGSKGITVGGATGESIKSVRNGRVVYVGSKIEGYGNLVVVKHDEHLITAYGNVHRALVRAGASVKQGQAIAEMGAQADGKPSFLFEVRIDRSPVDPLGYLSARNPQ